MLYEDDYNLRDVDCCMGCKHSYGDVEGKEDPCNFGELNCPVHEDLVFMWQICDKFEEDK